MVVSMFSFSLRPRDAQPYRMAAPTRAPEGRMQFSSYQTEGFYDEMFEADGAREAALPTGAGDHPIALRRPVAPLQARRRASAAATGHHLQRLRRHRRNRTDLPLRPDPAHRAGARMGPHRARPQAAHPRPQRLHRRHLSRPEDPQGRRHSRRSRDLRRLLPQAVPGPESARGASGATSPAPTWCATATANTTSWRTTSACPPASPTCWKIARC